MCGCGAKRIKGKVTVHGSGRGLLGNGLMLGGRLGRRSLVETNCSIVSMPGLPLATDWYKKGHEDEAGLQSC